MENPENRIQNSDLQEVGAEAHRQPGQSTDQSSFEHAARTTRFNIPIAIKLVSVSIVLLLAAAVPIAMKSADMFANNSTSRERDGTSDQANTRAIALETQLKNIFEKVKLVSQQLMKTNIPPEIKKENLQMSFHKSHELVHVEVYRLARNGKPLSITSITNENYLKSHGLNRDYINLMRAQTEFPIDAIFSGTSESPVIEIKNSSLSSGIPLMTVGVPLFSNADGTTNTIAIADIRLDTFQKIFTRSERTIFAIDTEGTILAHPDDNLTVQRVSMLSSPIVKKALSSKLRQGDSRFLDPETQEYFLGAFAKTSYGISVISQANEAIILEDAQQVQHEAFGITAMVLSIALFLLILFAMTLTAPIERLEQVARQISKGNFEIRTEVNSRDEVGHLAATIDDMVIGLKERDKAKQVINKFHGSQVAEDLLQGDLELRGSRKDVTVFFSDIRDFTKFSEGHSAEEVVTMLNEYFAVMVDIINRNDGMVDKFIGDAIMAVWGATSETNDCDKAMKACLEMRLSLEQLNQSRLERGLTEIKIGMGLHSGHAISGTIGSNERMEYTVIGDTVNITSRIEAATKSFGTDLLVSETVYELSKETHLLEMAGSAQVKGKAEPLKLFKVRGYFDQNGQPVHLVTKYSDYDAGDSGKIKVA